MRSVLYNALLKLVWVEDCCAGIPTFGMHFSVVTAVTCKANINLDSHVDKNKSEWKMSSRSNGSKLKKNFGEKEIKLHFFFPCLVTSCLFLLVHTFQNKTHIYWEISTNAEPNVSSKRKSSAYMQSGTNRKCDWMNATCENDRNCMDCARFNLLQQKHPLCKLVNTIAFGKRNDIKRTKLFPQVFMRIEICNFHIRKAAHYLCHRKLYEVLNKE